MSDFICKWWPTLTFLTGTLLGPLLYHLWFGKKRVEQEEELDELRKNKKDIERELEIQNQIASELALAQSEIERNQIEYGKLHRELTQTKDLLSEVQQRSKNSNLKEVEELNLNNIQLRKKIKKLKKNKKAEVQVKGKRTSEFDVFISELQQLITKIKEEPTSKGKKSNKKKKSKKKNEAEKETSKSLRIGKSKAKKSKKKEQKDRFAFYKEKYSKASDNSSREQLMSSLLKREDKNLTDLFGITPEISKILNKEGIFTFSDLSNTKIARLREILVANGDQFSTINPLNWPIQARIAEKGQWDILEEYKSKMDERLKP